MALHAYYDYQPDLAKLTAVAEVLLKATGLGPKLSITYGAEKHLARAVSAADIAKYFDQLSAVEFDFYYRPGNPDIREWGSVDLDFTEKSAYVRCYGENTNFEAVFNRCIEGLHLERSRDQRIKDFYERAKETVSVHLFEHIKGALRDGNYGAALSATVVFVEDRLRTKLSLHGQNLTGSELALHAFKTPGVLSPPLGSAGNAEDNAFILLKGWFGLVRNLHGHQVTSQISFEEAFAQLSGANYILWLIDQSRIK